MTETTQEPLPLTARQREVFDFIVDFADRHGYCVSVRDVQLAIGAASPNGAVCHLVPLRKKGYVTWDARTARSIRPVEVQHAAT
jgi:repressor LexA